MEEDWEDERGKGNSFRLADRDEARRKSMMRRKVEFAFHFVKDTFGYRKARYKELHKNLSRGTFKEQVQR